MTHPQMTRYTIALDVLERDADLADAEAEAILRREFALALNASYFARLSAGDIEIRACSRAVPQEGVARYTVVLELDERTSRMTDEQAAELLRREFQHALNASHFWRICSDDLRVTLAARERPAVPLAA